MRLLALIALYLCGFISGVTASSHAGIISHVVAYEIGKSSGKKAAVKDCICPETKLQRAE